MTRKQIDTAREARLWFGQIVIPMATAAVSLLAIPEVRSAAAAKATEIKCKIQRKFHKDRA